MFQRPERLLLIAAIALLLMACQFGARRTTPPVETVDARALTARVSTVVPSSRAFSSFEPAPGPATT